MDKYGGGCEQIQIDEGTNTKEATSRGQQTTVNFAHFSDFCGKVSVDISTKKRSFVWRFLDVIESYEILQLAALRSH